MLNIKRFIVNPFQENCYIVSDESKEAIIVDCGAFYPEEKAAIVNYINENGLSPKHLISTHGHVDHNLGNNLIFKNFRLPPEVHHKDKSLMDKLPEQAMVFMNYEMDKSDIPPVGKFLGDNDIISFGTHKFTIIPTPGHSPGSVFFVCQDENVAFSGDTLFQMSIGRTDLWAGSYNDILLSLSNISKILDSKTVILPGHGQKTTMYIEMKNNPYFNNNLSKNL